VGPRVVCLGFQGSIGCALARLTLVGATGRWCVVCLGHGDRDCGLLGYTCLAPPSSVLRLNPSVLIPKEGDNLRSPFQATITVRSNHAALAVVREEECNRLGSVFFGVVARHPDVAI